MSDEPHSAPPVHAVYNDVRIWILCGHDHERLCHNPPNTLYVLS